MGSLPAIGSVDRPTRIALLSLQRSVDALTASGGASPVVVLQDTVQSIPTSTNTDIDWPAAVLDPDGWVTSSTTLTVPVGAGGTYVLSFAATFSGSLGGAAVRFYLNGSNVAFTNGLVHTHVRTLVAGDTLRWAVSHGTGVSVDVTSRLEIAAAGSNGAAGPAGAAGPTGPTGPAGAPSDPGSGVVDGGTAADDGFSVFDGGLA